MSFVTDGAVAATNVVDADNVQFWNSLLGVYEFYGLNSADYLWHPWTNWNGAVEDRLVEAGQSFWYEAQTSFLWSAERPYTNVFPEDFLATPRVLDMYRLQTQAVVGLDIWTTGDTGETLDILYQDVAWTGRFESFGWELAATDIDTAGETLVTWLDFGSAERSAVPDAEMRFYLIGRADIDADADGLPDAREMFVYQTDPNLEDTDGDGLNDGDEISFGTSPNFFDLFGFLPFVENFETNTVSVGDLDGQNLWSVDQSGVALVQTGVVFAGSQALELAVPTSAIATVSHPLTAPDATVVWVDQMIRVPYSRMADVLPSEGSALVLFDRLRLTVHDGNLADGEEWVMPTRQPQIEADDWVRVTLQLNYGTQTWSIYLNGGFIAGGLGFASPQSAISSYEIAGRFGYTDSISVTTNQPSGLLSDGDSLPDSWELFYFGGLDEVDSGDADADGLDNLAEYLAGTDPTNADTDGDGLDDDEELNLYSTSPLDADSDGDGMPDGWEITYGLNPNDEADADGQLDGDGISNLDEYLRGTDPTDTGSSAITIYVSAAAGSDANDGYSATPGQNSVGPVASVTKGFTLVRDNDTISIAGGTYAESPATYAARGISVRVVVTGAVVIR